MTAVRIQRGIARARHPVAGVLACALVLSGPAAAQSELPDIGNPVDQVLSPQDEAVIGRDMMLQARRQLDLNEDPEIAGYIDRLGQQLAAGVRGRPVDGFTFFVVRDPRINAFAAPGGYVGINSGLILRAENEAQLAGVLAHEIAHVAQRHIARAFAASSRNQYKTIAAIVAGLLLGGQAGQAAIAAGVAGEAQRQINYTRANEYEADRIGIGLLAEAGYRPMGMSGFFEILLRESGVSAAAVPEYLRTHPLSSNRIAEAAGRAEQMGDTSGLREDSLEFHLMQARLEVLDARDPASLYSRWREASQPSGEYATAARRYGLALLEQRLGRPAAAVERLQALQRAEPDNLHYGLALSGALVDAGSVDAALETWRHLGALYPRRYAVVVQGARLLQRAGEPAAAVDLLTEYVRNNDAPAPEAWRELGAAAEAAGRPVRSHESLGEYYARTHRYDQAIQQFRIALDAAAANSADAVRLRARLEQVREQKRAQLERNPIGG
ncbi:MAG: M48 family metalloprotease [Halofilum sp. (in: g-proteobacteria)]|nr:M48 family metalloprotease [Halofilum sp. (in: g-proteobacteria)]